MTKEQQILVSNPVTGTTAKASSILQKNGKLYGPMNALDIENGTSCWNSDQGESQFYTLDFSRLIEVQDLKIQFQAGFSAEHCIVEAKVDGAWVLIDELEPEDVLQIQSFPLKTRCHAVKLSFREFTDFYGRITIYRIEVWGKESQ